tara:strand:+ start:3645 stop:3971 length:327 start_codon:yes stop_codon:yes gene_type:complete
MEKRQRGGRIKKKSSSRKEPFGQVWPKSITTAKGRKSGLTKSQRKAKERGIIAGLGLTAGTFIAAERASRQEKNKREDIKLSNDKINRLRDGDTHKRYGGAVGPNGIL